MATSLLSQAQQLRLGGNVSSTVVAETAQKNDFLVLIWFIGYDHKMTGYWMCTAAGERCAALGEKDKGREIIS